MDNVLCPHCGQAVLCDPQLAGRTIACPGCQGQFTMSAAPAHPVASVPAMPPLPPPVIRTSQPDLAPPVFVTAPPKQPHAAAKRPAQGSKTLLIAGIAAAALLLVGIGLVVVINWPTGESGGQATASIDPSRPLPPLDQLIGRSFPADHPDAAARIAEGQQRKISIMQGGGEVQIGDVSVSDNPISDYGGFTFGIITEKDGTLLLTTDRGEEPLQFPNSYTSHKSIVQKFLERHHGAANIRIEQLIDQPYYLARLRAGDRPIQDIVHGRSRDELQAKIDAGDEGNEGDGRAIRKIERVGTIVRAVYRLGSVNSDEEFLVLNDQVVTRFASSRGVSLGGD
jgi:hypothetical protein